MIDVSELMNDPDFATEYTVIRSMGEWQDGRFVLKKKNEISCYGPVQPATEDELEQLDIGDRNHITMKFMCAYPMELFITSETENEGQFSDMISYNGKKYKIIKVKPWISSGGYFRAFAYEVN